MYIHIYELARRISLNPAIAGTIAVSRLQEYPSMFGIDGSPPSARKCFLLPFLPAPPPPVRGPDALTQRVDTSRTCGGVDSTLCTKLQDGKTARAVYCSRHAIAAFASCPPTKFSIDLAGRKLRRELH